MQTYKKIIMAGILLLVMYGCKTKTADSSKGNATKEQDSLFTELNAASKRSVDRGNLRIDWQYAETKDLDCQDGELVEVNAAATRAITDYDFDHQQSITHFYAMEAADPQATDRYGVALCYVNGYYTELAFSEKDGQRTYQRNKQKNVPRKEAFPYEKNHFDMIVRDVDKEYFHIEKKESEKEVVYVLTLPDQDKMNERIKKEAEENGEDILNRNGCKLDVNEITDQKLEYHVSKNGYLKYYTASTTTQLNSLKKEFTYTASYETYDDFNIKPFKDMLE